MTEKLKELTAFLLAPTKLKRTLFFLLADVFIISFSFYSAFYLRFGFTFPGKYEEMFWHWLLALLVAKLIFLALGGLYNINWRFVGLSEMLRLLGMGILTTLLVFAVNVLVIRSTFPGWDLPRGIIIIEATLSFFHIGILRIAKRVFIQSFKGGKVGKKTLIVGANYTGERLIKELVTSSDGNMIPIVIVDEDPMKIGTRIFGIRVMGGFDKLPEIIFNLKIESVLINLPRAPHQKINYLFDIIKPTGITDIKVVPRIDEMVDTTYAPTKIKKLDIEDLLSRQAVRIDSDKIESYIKDKVVMVTGAAGSIGSEIVRQLMNFDVARIIGFEIDETEIFDLERDLKDLKKPGQEIVFIVGDVREKNKLEAVFERYRPQVVFHAAAYKHVPLMESFPEEAIKTNVMGTFNLAETAAKWKCEKFINISTDKAVNPTSVMGASKRMAEMICTAFNKDSTSLVSVRFGNVLGSRGSVVPIFLDQIEKGGPIEVTHKEMKRYFMSVPEAVLLVLQAAAMGNGGEVFVLDMGEPVKIVDLAENLIFLNDLRPYYDIDIVFTGLRPGEKLFEELLTAEEGTVVTAHEKIFVARNEKGPDNHKIHKIIKKLSDSLENTEKLTGILKEHVPFYKDS